MSRRLTMISFMDTSADASVQRFLEAVVDWCSRQSDVAAAALVGSHARGTARPDSDVDIVVVTSDPSAYVDSDDWAPSLAGEIVLTRRWGVLTERRLRTSAGLEVDLGVVDTSWTSTDPVDAGTSRVAREGLIPLYDPTGLLERLIVASR
jgi:predicted nucleotidyltransferase